MKTKSAKTTPKSNTIAARNPLVILVSSNTKNTGPTVKASKIPQGKADRMSLKSKWLVISD